MLVRLDPEQEATAVMSIPRDLKVTDPGPRHRQDQRAYSAGGADLTLKTLKQLLDIKINHVINVNFGGFRHAVNALGCVYVDVDRRYYHSNAGLPPSAQYAEIDVEPGYQRLCGQKALDYVRFRHADSDIVRAARQQDFLRAAKDQISTSSLIDKRGELIDIFAKATKVDAGLQTIAGLERLLKLGDLLRRPSGARDPLPRAVRRATRSPQYVDRVARGDPQDRRRLPPRARVQDAAQDRERVAQGLAAKRKKKQGDREDAPEANLVNARRRGEQEVGDTVARQRVAVPALLPAGCSRHRPATRRRSPDPRVYTIRDRAGGRIGRTARVRAERDRRPVLRRAGHGLAHAAPARAPHEHAQHRGAQAHAVP